MHLTTEELMAGVGEIQKAPKENGVLKMIVRRPDVDQREILRDADLDPTEGLRGDSWKARGSKHTEDGRAHPEMQLNIMNARAIALIAQEQERWQLAGDQLFIDMDLSLENLPAGTQLQIGEATIEVTAKPHTGCAKFSGRFGVDALKFVNSPVGRELRLRGLCARVVKAGKIKEGDVVKRI